MPDSQQFLMFFWLQAVLQSLKRPETKFLLLLMTRWMLAPERDSSGEKGHCMTIYPAQGTGSAPLGSSQVSSTGNAQTGYQIAKPSSSFIYLFSILI